MNIEENIDRILGFFASIAIVILGRLVLGNFNWSFAWWWYFAITIALGVWVYHGWTRTDIDVGWKGQILLLGQRTEIETGEGRRWTPYPFEAKATDCRQVVVKLDELEVTTKDDVTVKINGSIIRRVFDVNKFADVNPEDLKTGLDDIWDRVIRMRAREMDLKDLLGKDSVLKEDANGLIKEHVSGLGWGIEIMQVNIAGIKTDEKVRLAMELKVTENKEREGQEIEIAHFQRQVKVLTDAGLSREQAVEQVQLTIGSAKAKTIETKTFAIDPASAAIIAAAFGRKTE